MPKRHRRVRCPYCSGLNTKRHGSFTLNQAIRTGRWKKRKRWYCKDCNRTFTPHKTQVKYIPSVSFKAAHLYFNTKGSLQEVATELSQACRSSVTKRAVLKLLIALGKNCKGPIEVARELHLKWPGWLGIDATGIKISGVQFLLFVAVDLKTRDIVYFQLARHEDYETVRRLLLAIRDKIEYPLRGIVSDLGLGRSHINLKVVADIFPGVPHQICVVHLERDINLILPKTKRTPLQRELKKLIRDVLYARSKRLAIQAYMRLTQFGDRYRYLDKRIGAAIDIIRRNFLTTLVHFDHPELPRDNNIVEAVVGQLKERINLLRGFKRLPNAFYFTKLFVTWYRFKKFKSSGINEHNGHSPIALAGAKNMDEVNWIEWSQRRN